MEKDPGQKSVYACAAEAGPLMSLPLVAVAASVLLSNRVPGLGILALPSLLAAPFLLASLMKRVAADRPSYRSFFPLWLFGIYSFIFATLICALLSALYLVFIEPGFVGTYFSNAVSAMEEASRQSQGVDFSRQAEVFRAAVDNRLLPSPMELVASMSWLSAFTGSVLSALVARVVVSIAGKGTVTQ